MTEKPQNPDSDALTSNEHAQELQQHEEQDQKLDEALEMTFPASDPLAI